MSKKDLLKYKKNYGNDNIYYKEIIKKKLLSNTDLLIALDNPDLDPEEDADVYMEKNIRPYYMLLSETQTETKNFVCFETSFTRVNEYNRIMKNGQIIFYILCNTKNITDWNTGIARHDLIAAIIEEEFNWCTDFGNQLKLVTDKPYSVDGNYILRTLIFEQATANGIVDTRTQTITTDRGYE